MEKVLARSARLSWERAIGNTDNRVADRALCLTLKVQRDVFLEKADRVDDAPILRPNDLLYTQKPASPTTLRDANSLRVFDGDPLQRPVVRNFQRDLQLVFVDVVPRGDLVDSAGHFDREVFGAKFFDALWTLDAAKFGVDYDRGEVRGSIVCDRRK